MSTEEDVEKAAGIIREAETIVALTGAGISTESGIPDFRSPGKGLWEYVDPMEFSSITSFRSDPAAFYKLAGKLVPVILKARPNKGHKALARLEKNGKLGVVITQNIDNLHQRAGSENVIEVHGNLQRAKCIKCDAEVSVLVLAEKLFQRGEIPPKCDACGKGILKPDVVLFGEKLPEDAISKAWNAAENCDLMLVVGSSLVVQPVNLLPGVALGHGARLIIINNESTHMDPSADVVIHERIGDVLPEIVERAIGE